MCGEIYMMLWKGIVKRNIKTKNHYVKSLEKLYKKTERNSFAKWIIRKAFYYLKKLIKIYK